MIAPVWLALALQATPGTAPAPERWSVLADGCSRTEGQKNDIVVCAPDTASAPRLPLPDERPPLNRPRQPVGDPRAALDNKDPPCPPTGCTGVGIDLIGVGKKLVDEVRSATRGKHPGTRVPIPLD